MAIGRSRSVSKTARNKNRGETCDTVVKTSGSIYKEFLSCKTSNPEEKRGQEDSRGGHEPPGWRALVPRGHQVGPLGCFLFLYFYKYSKTDRKYFYGIFGVGLLTVSGTSSLSGFWSVLEGLSYVFLRCHSLNNVSLNINRHLERSFPAKNLKQE